MLICTSTVGMKRDKGLNVSLTCSYKWELVVYQLFGSHMMCVLPESQVCVVQVGAEEGEAKKAAEARWMPLR